MRVLTFLFIISSFQLWGGGGGQINEPFYELQVEYVIDLFPSVSDTVPDSILNN